eukprot:13599181-Alexandrium_andersonii.AAC.1
MEENCDFLNPFIRNSKVAKVNHELISCIKQHFAMTMDEDMLRAVLLQSLKLAVPAIGAATTPSDRDLVWVFKDKSPDVVKHLRCPMGGSVLFRPATPSPKAKGSGAKRKRGASADAPEAEAEEDSQTKGSKRSGGKGKGGGKGGSRAAKKFQLPEEKIIKVVSEGS